MLDWFTGKCLSVAIKRWPENRRADRWQEWQAELSWLREQPRSRRWWTQLRFGWSLAVSPKINPDGTTMGWREMLPLAARGFQPALALFGAVIVLAALTPTLISFSQTVYIWIDGKPPGLGVDPTQFNWLANGISAFSLIVLSTIAVVIGAWLGRRQPLYWAHRGFLRQAGSAAIAPPIVAIALAAITVVLSIESYDRGGEVYLSPQPLPAFAFWAVLSPVAAVAVVRLVRARRLVLAWVTGLLGMAVLLDLAAIVAGWQAATVVGLSKASAPLWFPLALLNTEGSGIAFGTINQGMVDSEMVVGVASGPVRQLLIFTLFLIGYGLAASRADVTPQPLVRLAEPVAPQGKWSAIQWAGAGFTAIFITLWGYAVSVLTAALNDKNDPVGEHHIWAHELRQAAIVGIVAGLVLMLARQGPVIAPAVVTYAVLMTADAIADRTGAAGPGTGFVMAGIAIVVLCGAWMLSRVFTPAFPRTERSPRRALIGIAVIAVFVAASNSIHVPDWETGLPWAYFGVHAVVTGMLVSIAVVASLGARERPIRTVSAVAIVVAVGGLTAYPLSLLGMYGLPAFAVAGSVLAALMLFLARPRAKPLLWTGIIAGSVVLALPIAYVQLMAAIMVGEALMAAAGYEFPVDGLPLLPGSLIIGTVLGAVGALVLFPKEQAAPVLLQPTGAEGIAIAGGE